MTRRELAGAVLLLANALVFVAFLLGVRLHVFWLQAGAASLLLLGTAIIFVALARMDLPSPGRRPAGADTRRTTASPFPSRPDVAHGSTAPPHAGGRAPTLPDPRKLAEDLEAFRERRRRRRAV
jgi:hypothetical protein